MWTLKSIPIAAKLRLVIMATTAAALLVTSAALFAFERINFNARLEQDLSTLAQVIGENTVTALSMYQGEFARGILAALQVEPQIVAACIYSNDGGIFEQYIRKGAKLNLPAQPLADGFHSTKDQKLFFAALVEKKTSDRMGTICLLADFGAMRNRLRLYTLIVALVLLISLAIAYVLSGRLQRVISEPILNLVETARVVSELKDYSIRAERRSDDELGSFVEAFNQMLGQIQQQDRALRGAKEELEDRVRERTRDLFALQRQNELILNSAAEGICGLDMSGKMTFVNPAAADIIGWTVPELVNQSEHKVLRHSDLDGVPYREGECAVCAAFLSGRPYLSADEIIWRKDETNFHAEYARTPILEDGKLVGAVVVFKDITDEKRAELELQVLNKQLQRASRQAGMEEVATGVLHNVGNVLNSVNVSATLVWENVRQSKSSNLAKLASLLREHVDDFGDFVGNDPKGKMLPCYLADLAEHLSGEQGEMSKELELLMKNVGHIKDIVAVQQSYSKVSGLVESLSLAGLVEDALQMNVGVLKRHNIRVVREYEDAPPVSLDKHKVLQILVNLMRNAKYALTQGASLDKQMTLRIETEPGRIKITVKDNGVGIPPENMIRIFSHGFTTKKDGHGFGLHMGALAAREMGGVLTAHSDGTEQGATFTLELPMATKETQHEYTQ